MVMFAKLDSTALVDKQSPLVCCPCSAMNWLLFENHMLFVSVRIILSPKSLCTQYYIIFYHPIHRSFTFPFQANNSVPQTLSTIRCSYATNRMDIAYSFYAHRFLFVLTLSLSLRLYILPYWSYPLSLIFDIWALWRSGVSARVPKCQKLKIEG